MTHRKSLRKRIRLSCLLEIAGHTPISGQTRDLSEQEAVVQSPALMSSVFKKPAAGETGLLTFNIPQKGTPREIKEMPREILRIPCIVIYVTQNIVGLRLNTIPLDAHQQNVFEKLLESES